MNNKLIIAAAGSGKTTYIINESLKIQDEKVLITTFTEANEAEIKKKFIKQCGYIPTNITIQTWFALLLQHGVKPYQSAIYEGKIDILFLDIDFKNNGKNGIEFAKDLRKINKKFYLVFLSAHQRYLYVSLTTKVFDYLIKPINRDTLRELVARFKDEFETNKSIFLHLNKWEYVRTNDILYIEKDGKKSIIFTESQKYTTSKNLNSLLSELPKNFLRCHKSYILNSNKVLSIDKKEGQAFFGKDFSCPISSKFEL